MLKIFSQYGRFSFCLEIFQIVWKVSSLSGKFRFCLDSFWIKLKIFSQYVSFPAHQKFFQIVWKYFSANTEDFQLIWKLSILSGKFSRLSGNIVQPKRKIFTLSENFPHFLKSFPDCLESFQFIWKA